MQIIYVYFDFLQKSLCCHLASYSLREKPNKLLMLIDSSLRVYYEIINRSLAHFCKRLFPLFFINLLLLNVSFAQNVPINPVRIYKMGDWVTFKNCNYPTSLTEGVEYNYFGTSGGVIPYQRYGRYWEEPYTVSDGMAGDFVTAVLYDRSTNYLWAAHEKGLSYLTPAAYQWMNISKVDIHLPEHNPIDRLGTDGTSIWVQAPGGFLFTVNKILGFFQSMETTIPDNVVWSPNSFDPLPSFPDYIIDSNYQFENRGLIIDNEFREFPISVFITDKSRDVYGGVWGLGLIEGDNNVRRLRIHPFGPMQNHINALAISNNALWMGGEFKDSNPVFDKSGLSKFYFSDGTWEYFEDDFIHELNTDQIFDLAYKNNHLWIGTNQGLAIYNVKKNRWRGLSISKGLSDEIITSIALEDSIAWIGTPLGLNIISIHDLRVKQVNLHPEGYLIKIHKISIGPEQVWISTDNGLYAVDKATHIVKHYDMFGNEISLKQTVAFIYNAIAVSDSILIFERYRGLIKYLVLNREWELLPEFGLSNEVYIYDMAIDDGYLWIGTSGGAVLVRLADFYTEHYTKADGLAGNQVYKVIVDGDRVWFATDYGLTKYQWRQYASEDK